MAPQELLAFSPAVMAKAATLVKGPGRWTQRAWWRDKDGKASDMNHATGLGKPYSRCIACALSQAKGHDISREIKALGFRSLADITRWNDDPKRTQAEVVDLLRRLATSGSQHEGAE